MQAYTKRGRKENVFKYVHTRENALIRVTIRESRIIEPVDEISNNVLCAASKASDQPAHTRSLIRAFASLWKNLRFNC